MNADDAVNYGAIGAALNTEITAALTTKVQNMYKATCVAGGQHRPCSVWCIRQKISVPVQQIWAH
jgi:hypothetical protein